MENLVIKRNISESFALWTQRITDCKSSGKLTSEWCAENGINVKTYYYWHNKIRKMVEQQNTSFYEIPRAQMEERIKPAATIHIADMKADIYPGADSETIRAICTVFRTC